MNDADAQLRRQMREVSRHVLPFFKEDPSDGIFSTVAIKLKDRCFLFTAGHCFEAAVAVEDRHWLLGAPLVRTTDVDELVSTTNIPVQLGGMSTVTGLVDTAIAEVFPCGDEAERLFDEAAVPLDQIKVVRADEIPSDAHVILTGFPGEAASGIGGTLLTPLMCACLIADGVEEPAPFAPRPFRIDLALPLDRMRNAYGEPGVLPMLDGTSGGGYWLVDGNQVSLIGTHAASGREDVVVDGERYRFAFGSTLHSHFGVIAKSCPELRDEVIGRWPSLEELPLPEPEILWKAE